MNDLICPNCSQPVTIEAVLQCVKGYGRGTNSGLAACPLCQREIEFQVRSDVLTVGYVYSSGSPHFEGLFDVPAPGITCRVDEHGVTFLFQGKRYVVPGNQST